MFYAMILLAMDKLQKIKTLNLDLTFQVWNMVQALVLLCSWRIIQIVHFQCLHAMYLTIAICLVRLGPKNSASWLHIISFLINVQVKSICLASYALNNMNERSSSDINNGLTQQFCLHSCFLTLFLSFLLEWMQFG